MCLNPMYRVLIVGVAAPSRPSPAPLVVAKGRYPPPPAKGKGAPRALGPEMIPQHHRYPVFDAAAGDGSKDD